MLKIVDDPLSEISLSEHPTGLGQTFDMDICHLSTTPQAKAKLLPRQNVKVTSFEIQGLIRMYT